MSSSETLACENMAVADTGETCWCQLAGGDLRFDKWSVHERALLDCDGFVALYNFVITLGTQLITIWMTRTLLHKSTINLQERREIPGDFSGCSEKRFYFQLGSSLGSGDGGS